MSADNDGRVSQNADNPMNHVGLDLDNLELTVLDFLNIPSPHITPYHKIGRASCRERVLRLV